MKSIFLIKCEIIMSLGEKMKCSPNLTPRSHVHLIILQRVPPLPVTQESNKYHHILILMIVVMGYLVKRM